MYPLSVLLKSPVTERKNAAESLMTTLKAHSTGLVEEALMVSSELIRVAILWLETWHEGLEDASRLYFVEGNVAGMLDILLPLHEKVESGAETWLESDFLKNFGPELTQAHLHIQEYVRLVNEGGSTIPSGPESSSQTRHTIQSEEAEAAMNRAWDIYYTFFRRVNKQLPSLTTLELSQCSPALSRARGLELGVPGSYRVDGSYVKIDTFVDSIHVITSKQRPRKITIRGSDGNDYMFLLKGHEDLRQDERVMQLFGLVNALLVRDPQTRKHDLRIQRYAISPLSHNCGLVGWVPVRAATMSLLVLPVVGLRIIPHSVLLDAFQHCDLLHSLIRDYRQSKRIPLNMENREMLKIAPDYDMLTVMQKVEVFTEALRKTTGQGNDLYEILWLKSTNSEEWLERRTKYTRSLAVMSMVGYILGLGDRHPSNLMLDKLSGRVLHIDFGDCFEVAMMREKFPERVPFRLTRMLIKAMEVSGIEGSYRSTCERVMSVLRSSRDSLIAMLEAFVYDPLISWRLVDIDPEGRFNLLSKEQEERYGNFDARPDAPHSSSLQHQSGAPIELSGNNRLPDVSELANEDDDLDDPSTSPQRNEDTISMPTSSFVRPGRSMDSRSLRMYADIQKLAANVSTESRIASLTAGTPAGAGLTGDYGFSVPGGSISRSRMERSMRQRELLSLLEGTDGAAHEEALNEKALKVIRRVQDKLTGTDFGDTDPTDVTDQVQRLIIQATSSENLCQLFVGWCAFW
jgi:phosphatidylinositol kinase/protein kinase (PI-3  family)